MPQAARYTEALTVKFTKAERRELSRAGKEVGIPSATLVRGLVTGWLVHRSMSDNLKRNEDA
jgi:hypothetical protein